MSKVDIGATSHYISLQNASSLRNNISYHGPSVILINAETIVLKQQRTLFVSGKLSKTRQTVTQLLVLRKSFLISLGQLCDKNCTVVLDKKNINVPLKKKT